MEKIIGYVKWYKANKKHGYIIGMDEELYYFDSLKMIDSNYIFSEGEKVKFIPHFEAKIPYATEVEKV